MNQQGGLVNFIIQLFLKNPELFVIAFVVLSSVFNFIGGSGKRLREAQRQAAETEEARRRGFMADEQTREANPNTQSYDGYLRRTEQPDVTIGQPAPTLKDLQADILEALQGKAAPNPQEELRRKLAEKMGRSAAPQAPLGRGKPPPPAPAGMKRPPPRATSKPIETTITSNIEVYLDSSSQEKLERDSMPDSLGHTQRQPHFDLPQRRDSSFEGAMAFKNEGGSTVTALKSIQEVRGKEIVPTARSGSRPATKFIDTKDAVSGFVWNEILSQPRSMRRR